MKKLITFGCSHTTGANLDDNFNLPLKVSKYAWGNIVAKEFNLEHDNKGYGGAANRYILYRILNYTYTSLTHRRSYDQRM